MKYLKQIIGVALAAAFALTAGQAAHVQQMQQEIAGKVIRFHVLANSDSRQDQQLKLEVRDQVGSMMEERLADAEDLEESRRVISESLNDIEECAQNVIWENGFDYGVTASLADSRFPVKEYGNSVFPAGTYEALRVTIGEGQGHNWWCVMYPNLCFSGSMYQVDEENSQEKLKAVLTTEEYKMIMESKDYKVRFQILTFLNDIIEK